MSERDFIIEVATTARRMLTEAFGTSSEEWKSDHTPVTDADRAVNRMVIEAVQKRFPQDGVLGEEESYEKKDASRLWVCDPIDGTSSFSRWVPIFGFSLALVVDGEPILAVTDDPIVERMLVAEKGKGTFLDRKRIHVSPVPQLEKELVGISVHAPNRAAIMDGLEARGAYLAGTGSIVYRTMMVALGKYLGAYADTRVGAHDCAAAALIVTEAGGKATGLAGEPQRYDGKLNGFIASNGLVHDQLVEIASKR